MEGQLKQIRTRVEDVRGLLEKMTSFDPTNFNWYPLLSLSRSTLSSLSFFVCLLREKEECRGECRGERGYILIANMLCRTDVLGQYLSLSAQYSRLTETIPAMLHHFIPFPQNAPTDPTLLNLSMHHPLTSLYLFSSTYSPLPSPSSATTYPPFFSLSSSYSARIPEDKARAGTGG